MKLVTVSKNKFSTRQITIIGMLSAITVVLGATGLGFIPIPPFKSTIMHIPVIVGGIIEGPLVGGMLGLIFGIFSIQQAIATPSPVTFVFLNPIIAIFPRILIGITSYYAYKIFKTRSKSLNIAIATVVGSFTNTIGVLGLIYIIYIDAYANALHISHSAAAKSLLTVGLNGFVTAGVAVVVAVPVILAVTRTRK